MLPFRKYMPCILLRSKSIIQKQIVYKGYCSESSKEKENTRQHSSSEGKRVPALRFAFENASEKTKDSYIDMVTIFINRDVHRRNHVEFIYAALKNMEAFGVHRDLEVYKSLIDVMPKGKFIPTNIFQAEFMHYPKQQQCIIDLLEQMEDYGVIPDYEMEAMLLNIFGKRGHPLRKYWRMMYWMPKFKNLSPWPLPNPVPDNTLELAKLAVERMCTVDLLSKVSTFYTSEIEDSVDDTWIVSGMSPEQSELLSQYDKTKPLYIEGPSIIWMRNKSVNYFTLRGDSIRYKEDVEDIDDVSNLKVPFFMQPPVKETRITKKKSIHQQEDGTIFAMCATGTSSKDSLLSWIRFLQKDGNSCLSEIPILFKSKSVTDTTVVPIVEEKR